MEVRSAKSGTFVALRGASEPRGATGPRTGPRRPGPSARRDPSPSPSPLFGLFVSVQAVPQPSRLCLMSVWAIVWGRKECLSPALETTFRSSSPTHELCMNCLANQAETCSRNRCIGERGALWRHTDMHARPSRRAVPPTWCTPRVPRCKAVNIARFAFRPELAPRDSCVASFRWQATVHIIPTARRAARRDGARGAER